MAKEIIHEPRKVAVLLGKVHKRRHPTRQHDRKSLTTKLPTASRARIMSASILNTARAVQMSVYVVRAFVKMRESLLVNAVLARDVAALKLRVDTLDSETRKQFDPVFEAIL
jgi:hypothetical protein